MQQVRAGERGLDVAHGELRVLIADLLVGEAVSEAPYEHAHRDASSTDARLAMMDIRRDDDPFFPSDACHRTVAPGRERSRSSHDAESGLS